MRSKHFHIVTGGTPGLVNDAKVVSEVLASLSPTSIHLSRQRNLHLPYQQMSIWTHRMFDGAKHLGIFLENIPLGWQKALDRSVFIPNQEWMRPETLQRMAQCRHIWCKTHYAQRLFAERGYETRFIGFTSRDCMDRGVTKDFDQCLHIQGRSQLKGTEAVLKVWASHPTWPQLTVVSRDHATAQRGCSNIKVISDYLTDAQLGKLMNTAGIHLCTSETEGFGHYINEALSVGAVVVTTNAPPMNELVSADCGILVNYERVSTQGFSEKFHVDPADLEAKIETLLSMPTERKLAMGQLARARFIATGEAFKEHLICAVGQL